jgi:PAS domain S-box-containing protein
VARIAWMPYCILAVTLLMTFGAARSVALFTRTRDRARFDSAVERAREQFQRAINGNLILLDGLRGLANARLTIGKQQFQQYVDSLELRANYPGVQGMGFAMLVHQDQKAAQIGKIITQYPSFHIWPNSERSEWCPVVYLAPSDGRNDGVIGYDLCAERLNFAALAGAAETGHSTALVKFRVAAQSTAGPDQAWFFLAAPVYWSGKRPDTHSERLKQFYGFVLCAYETHDLFKALSDSLPNPEIAFRVYDGVKGSEDLLYDATLPSARQSKAPVFTSTRALSLVDRTMTVEFLSTPEFLMNSILYVNPFIAASGTLISLLLFGVMLAQAKARAMAEQHAQEQHTNEMRFRHLIEQSLVGIYVIQNERFVYVNPKMAEIFGCSQEELTSMPVFDFIAAESLGVAKENMEKRLKGEVESIHYELRGLRRDGKVIDVEAHGGRVEYNGQPAILGALMDVTEKKRDAERKAWLSSFPERNPQPIIELDPAAGVIDYFNPAAGRLFPDLQNLGFRHPFLEGLSKETAALFAGAVDVLRREVTVGEFCYAQTVNYLPESRRLRVYGSDITARKEIEAQMERQRSELQVVLDTVPALIFYKDAQHRLVRVNEAVVRLVGLPKEAMTGKTDAELGSEYAEQYFRDEDEVMASGEAKRGIIEPMKAATGTRWLQTDKIPYRDATGRIVGVIGFAMDITERKRAEERVQAQLSRLDLLSRTTRAIAERQDLRSIFQVVVQSLEEHMPVDFSCLCHCDSAREELTVACIGSRSASLATELAMTEQARISIDQNGLSRCVRGELVYEPDIASSASPFPQRLARGGLRSVVAAPLIVESTVFGVLIAARRQPEGFSSGQCEFLRQLSEHVALAANQAQLHGALQQAYDDLRRTQQTTMQQERLRALGQMASGVAHDINNAISPVALYTESLIEKEPNLTERGRNYLVTIQRAIDDVAATVSRMQDFYRQREPQMTLTQASLNRLVQQVLDLTRARWSDMPQERGIMIEVRTELDPDLPTFNGAESEIRDALTNLVINAVDAMPEGGALTLRTRVMESAPVESGSPGARHVCVEVADTGVGMDEETRRRCLEPFFTTKGERGSGLGLAMVYGVAQRHTGEIEIESAPGQGSTVRLKLPVSPSTLCAPVRNTAPPAPAAPLRLLIVDDDPLVTNSLRNILEGDGHTITAADGGQAGIDAFLAAMQRGEPFATVISDLGMPRVDGRKVAAAVKAASPSTPVILLTGWGQRLIAEGDVPTDVDYVLGKPPKLRELREALAHCREGAKP